MSYRPTLLPTIFIGLMLVLTVACTSNTSTSDSSESLCDRGFILPPGSLKCIKIDDIIANRVYDPSPLSLCLKYWKRLNPRGFCFPIFSMIGCGDRTFACNSEGSDVLRLIKGLPDCKQGTIVDADDAPLFDQDGLVLVGARPVLLCSAPSIGKPV